MTTTEQHSPRSTAIGETVNYEVTCVSGHNWPWMTISVPGKTSDEAERHALNRLHLEYPTRSFVVLETRKVY